MAKRAIVRLGDRTTHGGTVVEADPTYSVYGKNVARMGDQVSCPKCKGTYPIVSGAPTVLSEKAIARQDDLTSCGAKLIASQGTATIDDGSGGSEGAAGSDSAVAPAAVAAAAAPAALAQAADEPAAEDEVHAIRFQAVNPETGDPEPKCVYILTREDGTQHGGVTDQEGYTEIVETTRPEQIGIHFMFKSPKGDTIDREDLTA